MICTYSAGYGHHKAAEAIKEAFFTVNPATGVHIIDPFECSRPYLNSVLITVYLGMIKKAPSIYRFLYEGAVGGKQKGISRLFWKLVVNRTFLRQVSRIIDNIEPGVVLCVHPFTATALSRWRDSMGGKGPAITGLVTDYTIHPFWWNIDLDGYFIAAPELAADLVCRGVPRKRIWPVGIPVADGFSQNVDKGQLKLKLGLDSNKPAVLIMGGGLGLGGIEEVVRCIGFSELDVQLLVVTGTNARVQKHLSGLVGSIKKPVRVLGFVDNVPELMKASDMVISKPGGITVAEVLTAKLPLLIWQPIPGQEERNASFLTRKNLALQVKSTGELVSAVSSILDRKAVSRLDLSLMNRMAARNIAGILSKTYLN